LELLLGFILSVHHLFLSFHAILYPSNFSSGPIFHPICCHDPLRLCLCGSSSLCQCAVERWDMTPSQDHFPRACETQIGEDKQITVVQILCHLRGVDHCSDDLVSLQSFGSVGSAIHLHPCLLSGWSSCWTDVVLTIGQLIAQLSVEEFTLPFLNLSGCHLVTRVCFAAEWICICHFSWLLFRTVSTMLFGFVVDTSVSQPKEFTVVAADDKAIENVRAALAVSDGG
jgi:hypothetical protein